MRLLIIDDSSLSRRLLKDALETIPNIHINTASSGITALEMIKHKTFDLVTLDVEMPELDGLETLKQLRQRQPDLPVIMCSVFTERGAATTIDALFLGANDYVTKPNKVDNINQAIVQLQKQLLPKIASLTQHITPTNKQSLTKQQKPHHQRIDILAIGSSTGGPNALTEVLSALPAPFPVPIVIVQHTLPLFSKHIANRLSDKCRLNVREAQSDSILAPGQVWLAPGDQHIYVKSHGGLNRLYTQARKPEDDPCPSIDKLFSSLVNSYGNNTLAVVLTGMGQDGLQGAREIHQAGGKIFAQDRESSVVWGMPRAVTEAGICEKILPITEMAEAIMNAVNR